MTQPAAPDAAALIAGGEVISTIKGGIINPEMVGDPRNFIWLMTGAVLAGAMWLNLATILGDHRARLGAAGGHVLLHAARYLRLMPCYTGAD